jgi:signal transduction histidine kinase
MAVDSVWAVLLLMVSGLEAWSIDSDPRYSLAAFLAVALPLSLLLLIRRRYTDAAVVAGALIGVGQLVVNLHPVPPDVALLVLTYSAAAFGRPWVSRLAATLGLLAGPLTLLRFVNMRSSQGTAILAFEGALLSTPFVLSWVFGRFTRVRRAYYAELEDRAARLERERDAQSKVAVAAERARIARELHDVVAHNVSVMIVQADGAAFVLDGSPEQAKEALAIIASTGRQALEEMRRLLGVLRSSDAGGEYVPQPGVEQLPELLEQVRSAGLPVAFAVEGDPRPLPRGVELTAYRIVQEALTNVRKHGGPDATASVRLCFAPQRLQMLIEDDGRGASADSVREGGVDGLGHGLIGMRERVGMVGGTLDAGPRPGGGFRIDVVLPLRTPERHSLMT